MERELDHPAEWPYRTLILTGTFGWKDPAGKRLHRQAILHTGLLVLAMIALLVCNARWPALAWLPSSVVVTVFLLGAFRLWQYIANLDELSRRIQLEALAMTYLVGFGIFFALGMLSSIRINPVCYVFLEFVRGPVLALRARSYR